MSEPLYNIAAAIDFSQGSKAALLEAMRIAEAQGASLTAIHVLDSELADYVGRTENMAEAEMLEKAHDRLQAYVEEVLGVHAARIEVLLGYPFVEIFRFCKNHQIDMLVLGSQGCDGDIERTGVLSRRCVRKVPAQVLLVRAVQKEPFSRIVACVDFSENSEMAIESALQLAEQDDAALHLLHVCRPVVPGIGDKGAFSGFRLFDIALPPYPEMDYAVRQREKLEALGEEVMKRMGVERKIISHAYTDTRPAHGIVSFLRENNADLAVLGTRGRTGIKSILLGTTAERIVNQAHCSVLAIKPKDFDYEL